MASSQHWGDKGQSGGNGGDTDSLSPVEKKVPDILRNLIERMHKEGASLLIGTGQLAIRYSTAYHIVDDLGRVRVTVYWTDCDGSKRITDAGGEVEVHPMWPPYQSYASIPYDAIMSIAADDCVKSIAGLARATAR